MNTGQKIEISKVIIFVILTNLLLYLILLPTSETTSTSKEPFFEREDYVSFIIVGELKTSFEQYKPISIIEKKKMLVPHAILLSVDHSNEESSPFEKEINTSSTNKLNIYVHKKYVKTLLNKKGLTIIPINSITGKTKNKRQYEIYL